MAKLAGIKFSRKAVSNIFRPRRHPYHTHYHEDDAALTNGTVKDPAVHKGSKFRSKSAAKTFGPNPKGGLLVGGNSDHSSEDETVRLEESESEWSLSMYSSSSSLLGCPTREEALLVDTADKQTKTKTTTDSAASASVSVKPVRAKKVSFANVTTRHYDLILGDNPHCKYPLSLGWDYQIESTQSVEDHQDVCQQAKEQAARDRIQPRLYTPPDNGTDTPLTIAQVSANHYMADVHMECDYDDEVSRKSLSELSMQERRTRLRAYGYTEAALRQAERRRRVNLALEWSAHKGEEQPEGAPVTTTATKTVAPVSAPQAPFPYSSKFVTRYAR